MLGLPSEALNALNQAIATFPAFLYALGDKALLLATAGEWDQALDTAQRLLDSSPSDPSDAGSSSSNLDALKVIAVHAFTQESQPHDAVQKLEDLDAALATLEPSSSCSVACSLELPRLFSVICCRQPRALQICVRMLEKVLKHRGGDPEVLSLLGHIHIMQGAGMFEKAMKVFRAATKRDEGNISALKGMILCQLCEGSYEDAEAQMELLNLMHGGSEDGNTGLIGHEFAYLQALLIKVVSGFLIVLLFYYYFLYFLV
jgi:tetratricopeptide repeat protein 21B